MTKTIRSLLALLLATLMVFSLAACQTISEPHGDPDEKPYEPESATDLWEKIDETMDALESFETENTAQVLYYYMGYEIEMHSTGYAISVGEVHYEEAESVVSCDEIAMSQTLNMVEAYYDGKMYTAANDGTYDQKFCSEMTFDEYKQTKTGDLVGDIDIADCIGADFSKGEDGTWNLKFSGYTKKTIDKVLETLSLTDDMLGASIADMEVSLVADANFRAQKMGIVFTFTAEEGESVPEFSVMAEYSKFNEAEFDPAKLNAEEYVTVPDVRILDDLENGIKDLQNASFGKFALEINTTTEVAGQTSVSQEKDTVYYGKKNGAYYYDITANLYGENYIIRYQNGMQTVITGGQTQNAAQTDEEAKLFIDGLINSANYTKAAVTGIEKQGEGVYSLKVAQLELSEYAAALEASGIELTSGNQEITVTFAEGKLAKIESKITLSGVYSFESVNESMTMIIESVVTFDDVEGSVEL